jgi:hypothetical protein
LELGFITVRGKRETERARESKKAKSLCENVES